MKGYKLKAVNNLFIGKFIKENKNRFICQVLVYDEIVECYVLSASKLNNYIQLNNKEVLLIKNKGKNVRTEYSLFAVKYYSKYIMLNLNMANKIVEEYINDYFSFEKLSREKSIEGYISDFILEKDGCIEIIEAKGIISTAKKVVFPSVYSQRAIDQLLVLLNLLKRGYKVYYFYVSLSSTVRHIEINTKDMEYTRLFKECTKMGMEVLGIRSYLESGYIRMHNDIKIEFS